MNIHEECTLTDLETEADWRDNCQAAPEREITAKQVILGLTLVALGLYALYEAFQAIPK